MHNLSTLAGQGRFFNYRNRARDRENGAKRTKETGRLRTSIACGLFFIACQETSGRYCEVPVTPVSFPDLPVLS
jgi:hypothetical protein